MITLKSIRNIIKSEQYICLVNNDGRFFCTGPNSSLRHDFDSCEVEDISAGNASFGIYSLYIKINK